VQLPGDRLHGSSRNLSIFFEHLPTDSPPDGPASPRSPPVAASAGEGVCREPVVEDHRHDLARRSRDLAPGIEEGFFRALPREEAGGLGRFRSGEQPLDGLVEVVPRLGASSLPEQEDREPGPTGRLPPEVAGRGPLKLKNVEWCLELQ
jgi:hypothetical protein